MQQRVRADWSSTAAISGHVRRKAKLEDYEERAGNIVPFFPVDWSKHANYVYDNTRVEPAPKRRPHNEAAEAEYSMWYASLDQSPQREPSQLQVDGARPTSGKHYARKNADANAEPKRYLGDLVDRSGDPLRSDVAENYSNTRKVQGLLDKLASYMGEGFDKEDFLVTIKEAPEEAGKTPRKGKKKEGPLQSSLPIGNLAPIRESLVGFSSTQAYEKPPLEIEAEDDAVEEEPDSTPSLPQLSDGKLQGRFRRKKASLPPGDNLFTYKEMEFGLTDVGGNQNRMPGIG